MTTFNREKKEDRPVVAICYDFDKTLSPDDMQSQGLIKQLGYDVNKKFWDESNKLADENNMDQNLAWMYKIINSTNDKGPITKEKLKKFGSEIKLSPGVGTGWFERIRNFGNNLGVIIEHYIISCGLKEMIEGTPIANEFKRIYASSYYFDDKDVAIWPAQAINYTSKTQFLFRIEKGILEENDQGVNDHFSDDNVRIPFRNMIYIGDSATDIPCMTLVNTKGGHSIGVYDADSNNKRNVYTMIRDNRIRYYAPADYTDGSQLDRLVKGIIRSTVLNEKLEEWHKNNQSEQFSSELFEISNIRGIENHKLKKNNGILNLQSSNSFANTHTVIASINQITDWTQKEIEELFQIGRTNTQVSYILSDYDVLDFYKDLLSLPECKSSTQNAKYIKEQIKKYDLDDRS